MDRLGIDLHKRESQLCTITEDGELLEQRITTSRERLTTVLGSRTPARILLEASTDALVRTRTRYVAIIKAFVWREGLRLASGDAEHTVAKLLALPLAPHVHAELAPLVALWAPLDAEITAADARLIGLAKDHPVVTRLRTMPGIGPVTAIAFVAALDDVTRFQSAHQVQAYLGLVPNEDSSGDHRLRGRITKRGDARMRWLLGETAWRILRSPNAALAGLKAWALAIAQRRGTRIATVALARRVAGILFAMWRDDAPFQALPLRAVAA